MRNEPENCINFEICTIFPPIFLEFLYFLGEPSHVSFFLSSTRTPFTSSCSSTHTRPRNPSCRLNKVSERTRQRFVETGIQPAFVISSYSFFAASPRGVGTEDNALAASMARPTSWSR
jgi:hypothetical protein